MGKASPRSRGGVLARGEAGTPPRSGGPGGGRLPGNRHGWRQHPSRRRRCCPGVKPAALLLYFFFFFYYYFNNCYFIGRVYAKSVAQLRFPAGAFGRARGTVAVVVGAASGGWPFPRRVALSWRQKGPPPAWPGTPGEAP